jgi:hypothetical protein
MSSHCLGFLCTRWISCVSPYDVKFVQDVVLSTGFDLSVREYSQRLNYPDLFQPVLVNVVIGSVFRGTISIFVLEDLQKSQTNLCTTSGNTTDIGAVNIPNECQEPCCYSSLHCVSTQLVCVYILFTERLKITAMVKKNTCRKRNLRNLETYSVDCTSPVKVRCRFDGCRQLLV